jgi:PAS domain S-box-containing protein
MTNQMTKQTDEVEILTATTDLRGLLESGAGFRMAVDSIQDYAVFAMDPEGRLASWNPGSEHLLGYGQEEILGRDAAIFFTPEDRQRGVPQQELKTAAEKGRASDDRWHVRKDGTYFFANGVTTGLRDAGGTLQGFIKIMRDRTDRKRLDEELQNRNEALARADREKDEFLAVLAHECAIRWPPSSTPCACSTRSPWRTPSAGTSGASWTARCAAWRA